MKNTVATLTSVAILLSGVSGVGNATPLHSISPTSNEVSTESTISDTEPSEITNQMSKMDVNSRYTFVANGRVHEVVKTTQGFELLNEGYERSVCATALASVLLGIGAAALLATAAAMGPGAVVVIGGYGFTAGQLTAAAGAMGSMSAVEAFLDSKVCK